MSQRTKTFGMKSTGKVSRLCLEMHFFQLETFFTHTLLAVSFSIFRCKHTLQHVVIGAD